MNSRWSVCPRKTGQRWWRSRSSSPSHAAGTDSTGAAIPEMPAEPEPEVFLPPESALPAKTAPAESSRQVVAPLATAAAAYTVRMPAESKPEPKPPLELTRREPVSVPAQPAAPDAEESPYQF